MPEKPAEPSSKPTLTREQLMDERAAADFAAMEKVNSDRTIEQRIMTEPGFPWEPQPSEKNRAPDTVSPNADLTFSRAGERQYGNSSFMRVAQGFRG